MVKLNLSIFALVLGTSSAFAPSARAPPSTLLSMSSEVDASSDSRRDFFTKVASSAFVAVGVSLVHGSQPANAFGGGGLNKVNAKLYGYGLPAMDKVADGFSPLLEIWGKGRNRDPLLVQFAHPLDWVVTLPSQDVNGEDGTIQAGEYAKGDTATFFVYVEPGKVESIADQPKDFFAKAIIKSISQKGDNIYQNFKITKIDPRKGVYKDQDYAIVDFKYELLTGAGFEVDRIGVASVTSAGNAVEVLWTASTRQRYKKTEQTLRNIAESFRCYADGLNLAKIEYSED